MPPQQKSGISLALPRAPSSSGSSQSKAQQQDLGASGMTGDDDSVLGREYVVVEKRNVEVNALADGASARIYAESRLTDLILTQKWLPNPRDRLRYRIGTREASSPGS